MMYLQKISSNWKNLEKRFISQEIWEEDLLTLWRERVILFLYLFAVIFGPIALIPSLILSYKEKLVGVFILDFASYMTVLISVIFYKKLSLNMKTWIAFSIFYFLGTGLLFALGFYGAGYIWLFGAAVIVGAMIGIRESNIALILNFLSLVSIGIFIAFWSPQWSSATTNPIQKWVVMTANFILVNIMVTFIVSIILNSLKIILVKVQKTAIELSDKQEELMAILKASPDPILVYDNEDNVQYINNAFTSTFGWYLDEVKGKQIPFVPEGEKTVSCRLFSENLNPEETAARFETIRMKKDGTPLNISLSASPIRGNKGEMIGVVVNLKDITEIKKMEVNLQQSQKMESIGRLAGGIAHDFNNILFPILGHTEMLLDDTSEDKDINSRLEKIYTASLRAKDLVKQILTFSRQESGELIIMRMQPVIKEALKLIRSTISTTIEIKLDIDNSCKAIKADPTHIHQVVMNLATNAYHAMEETGGELKVALKEVEVGEFGVNIIGMEPGTYACLMVSDTGHGMDKNITQKIFDPFFTTKPMGKGTGMGLSVVHGIVKKMDGTIKIYSEPDRGTVFYIYIPVADNSLRETKVSTDFDFKGGNERVLLVDDDKEILLIEIKMLEYLGYKVTSCNSSMEALKTLKESPYGFDLVITDMAMPKIPGDKLSAEILNIRPDMPILLCTGFSEALTKEKAEEIGIRDFIYKPVDLREFSHKIREVIEKSVVN